MRSSNVTRSTPLIVTTLNWIIRLNDRQTNLGSINKKPSNKEKAPGSFDWHVPTTTRHGLISAQKNYVTGTKRKERVVTKSKVNSVLYVPWVSFTNHTVRWSKTEANFDYFDIQQSNFIHENPGWQRITSLYDWSIKLAPLCQPIRCKIWKKTRLRRSRC